jgi:hypothetical protein
MAAVIHIGGHPRPPSAPPARVIRTKNLVAAASLRAPTKSPDPDGTGGATRQWQRECWGHYDEVGPAHYSGRFVGSCLSRVQFVVALPDEDGNPAPAFDDEGNPVPGAEDAPDALALLRDLRSPRGGPSQIMRALGLNLFVAGECFLIGQDVEDERHWEVLSIDEIRKASSDHDEAGNLRERYERIEYPGATAKALPPSTLVLRIWQSHPRWAYLADSSLRAVRDICEEITLLTREIRGQTISRLASAGVFVVPSEIEYEPAGEEADDEDDVDAFTRDLLRTYAAAVADKSSAAATVPFILRAPYDYCDEAHLRHIIFNRPTNQKAAEDRTDAILRYAQGIDLPVEVTTGHAGTSFSNAWKIDEDLFKAHIEPLVELVVDALTQGYLRTNLPDTPLVVWYDAGELVAHPDRTGAAKDGHDRFVISNAAYRGAIGFTDADAPDEEELAERVAIATAIKMGGSLPGDEKTSGVPGVGPITTGENPVAEPVAASAVPIEWQVASVVDFATARAVERAGARIRSKANGGGAAALLRGIHNRDVAATLGPSAVREMMGDEDILFRGEFDSFRTWAAPKVGADEAAVWTSLFEVRAKDALYGRRH